MAMVNSSFAYLEKIHLKALGETVWIACCFVKHCLHCQFFDFELEDGERLAGEVNRWWKDIDLQKPILQTKTVDLKSAYKQFAISPEDRRLSVLALNFRVRTKHVGSSLELCLLEALPRCSTSTALPDYCTALVWSLTLHGRTTMMTIQSSSFLSWLQILRVRSEL